MASSHQQQQQTQAYPAVNNGAGASVALGGSTSAEAAAAPANLANAAASAASKSKHGYEYYSTDNIQQAGRAYAAATAAIMGSNDDNCFRGGETMPTQLVPVQMMAMTAATAALQAKAQSNPTNVQVAAAGHQGFDKIDHGDSGAEVGVGVNGMMSPQLAQWKQQGQPPQVTGVAAASEEMGPPPPATRTTEGRRPTFVNAKQYKRILRRREERALMEEIYSMKRDKVESQRNNYGEEDAPGKTYMHKSRSLHAKKRPRNKNGSFKNKTELEEYYRDHPEEDPKRFKGDDDAQGKGCVGEEGA